MNASRLYKIRKADNLKLSEKNNGRHSDVNVDLRYSLTFGIEKLINSKAET